MADDSNDEIKSQVYLTERDFTGLIYDYERTYLKNINPNTMLLYAKAYYVKQKYEQCIKVLQKIQKTFSTKILYQRQALLFKATYLLDPSQTNQLQRIVRDYEVNRTKCPGKRLTEFHHHSIQELMGVVGRGRELARAVGEVDKEELKERMKQEEKRTKYEGFPSYLLSVRWNKKFNEFLFRKGQSPGPISNFELINHVFQLTPHEGEGKEYMDVLMFPAVEQEKYYVLGKRHWQILQKIFSGFPIKRVYANNAKTRQLSGGDNLVKTLIEYKEQKYVMQWQSGTFWDKSVIPTIAARFGPGQLKQQTRNKDYLVVQPGKVEQLFYPLKYISVDTSLLRTTTQKQQSRKRKILTSFDLEKYNPDECKLKGTVGLANLGNTCYMNSALQFLSNLKAFANFFLANRHLAKINISQTNKDGSFGFVTCAYGDLVKRLWFSHKDTRYIDPSTFKKTFGQRHLNFQGNQQEDAQQFLMFLLNCIHEDLNQHAQMNLMHRQSMGGKAFDTVRNIAVNHYNKHNKSIISDLFHGFRFEEIRCDECKYTAYRFEPELMLHIQAPPDAPKISAFVVEAKDLTEAKKIEIYIAKLEKVEDALKLLQDYFKLDPASILIPFMYYDEQKQWQIVQKDKDINYISRCMGRGGYFFVSEVKKPESDEQIAMFSFYYETTAKYDLDGFPRFVSVKKTYKEAQYEQQLNQLVFSMIPKNKIVRDRKDYLKQLKTKKIKSKIYQINYRVYFELKVSNYSNTLVQRIIGQNVNEESVNLEGCLARMSREEVIDQWNCEKCGVNRTGQKTDKIYSTARYMIIQIKRFTQSGKISTKVDYPISNLNMRPFIQEDRGVRSSPLLYNLQAVILHRGSLNSGHYTCICRNSQRTGWLYYDDESVREIQEKQVVDGNAYILVYEEDVGGVSYVSIR